ncbi:MAG: selenocysteine-specific elongation factor [Solirubrobacteraceae bacterium]|nr:selenocysteine-specific elongation factor [Solirubrobacteraceae bacterium]
MSAAVNPLTVGTAGHVDHGKSALVSALTGAGTDRLPEERARGMTITLGYAALPLPGGGVLSMIDVPGHERLVRVMVSGASGIDMFLLVIAADDGVMPQTVEHLRVLRALEIGSGVVAVTKSDLADPAPTVREAGALLPGTPIAVCSTRTMEGVADVAAALERVAGGVRSRAGDRSCVLHVDRVFSIRGAGTVVTGTLWSGSVARGERLQLLPSGRAVRVRGVQVHDSAVERAAAGQRVAVNLTGVRREEVARGDVLASHDSTLRAAHILDAALELDGPRPQRERVQVHHGTRESAGRLVLLGDDCWQMRLERPLLAAAGDRLVVRSISPPDTIGGGVVLDPHARRHGPSAGVLERLGRMRRGEQLTELQAGEGQRPRAATSSAGRPVAGTARPEPQGRDAPLSAGALALEERLRGAGARPPSEAELGDAAAHLPELRAAGRAVRVGRSMYAHVDAVEQVGARVRELIVAGGSITLAELRDELGVSRRHAQALLEHLDAARVTLRLADDSRVLRGSRADPGAP